MFPHNIYWSGSTLFTCGFLIFVLITKNLSLTSYIYNQTGQVLFSRRKGEEGINCPVPASCPYWTGIRNIINYLFLQNESFGRKIKERNYEDLLFILSIPIFPGWIMIFQDVRKLFASIGVAQMKKDKEEKKQHQQNSPIHLESPC